MIVISATVKKVKFSNELTGWGVAEFLAGDGTLFFAKGNLGSLHVGFALKMSGVWVDNSRGRGQVLEVSHYEIEPPSTSEGHFLYLTSGLFKGMTKKIARELVNTYGDKTLSLLEHDFNIILTVKGVGLKTFLKLRNAFQEAKPQQQRLIVLINDYRFSFAEALNILDRYPENALNVLSHAPYGMCSRLDKIPFRRFDEVMMGKGWSPYEPQRIREVLMNQLKECSREGSTCMPYLEVLNSAIRYLAMDRYVVENELSYLIERRWLFLTQHPRMGWLLQSKWNYIAEKEIANRLNLIQQAPSNKELVFNSEDSRLERLKSHQLRAVVAPFHHKVSVITGRPGSGKTTLLRTLLDLIEEQNLKILALSPTGKAAQRLREVTGRACSTIHRALGATHEPDVFMFNDLNPLDADIVLIDESSMLDTAITRSLLRAIPLHARIIFIGDVEQLPSVGPGAIFRDIIQSGCFPVYWLTEVLRITKSDGSIPTPLAVSLDVLEGKFEPPANDDEWQYIETNDNQETLNALTQVISEMQASGLGYTDIQVFSPINNGEVGVDGLNQQVKKCFFPDKDCSKIELGDKVMQRVNNYDLRVYNGDIGVVALGFEQVLDIKKQARMARKAREAEMDDVDDVDDVDESENNDLPRELSGNEDSEQQGVLSPIHRLRSNDVEMVVSMSDGFVEYSKKNLSNLSLAFATSGHKSQGSEYPYVVIVIPDHHYALMDRYWFYTLITRCQRKVIILGGRMVIDKMVKSRDSHLRRTALVDKLHRFLPVVNIEFK